MIYSDSFFVRKHLSYTSLLSIKRIILYVYIPKNCIWLNEKIKNNNQTPTQLLLHAKCYHYTAILRHKFTSLYYFANTLVTLYVQYLVGDNFIEYFMNNFKFYPLVFLTLILHIDILFYFITFFFSSKFTILLAAEGTLF